MIFAETERLILRRPTRSDLEPMVESWSEPAMTRYTGVRPNIRDFLGQLIEDMHAKAPGESDPGGPWYQYAVVRKEDGLLVGDIGVGFHVPGERQAELGYRIHPDHHRKGYAREAVTAIIDHLAEHHDLHRFIGVVASENAASIALLRALGFRQEGHFRQSFLCGGEWLDDAYFALLASEWREGKRPPAGRSRGAI